MRILTLALLFLLPVMATGEEVVIGLSQDEVAITTVFDGSEILIFGAVKREAPIRTDSPLEVIITLAGPSEPVVVRRKAKRFGIWVNTDTVKVDQAPSFYAVATTAPLADVLSNVVDQRHHITIDQAVRWVGGTHSNLEDSGNFTEAVIRIRRNAGLYQLLEGQVSLDQQTLFRTSISMPSNLTEGDYTTRIYLTRNGNLVSQYEAKIDVRKVGLERWLYTLSRQKPIYYGLMSLAIAIAAGWGASTAFRVLRRS